VPKSFNTVEKATLCDVLEREDSGDFEESKKQVYEVMEDPVLGMKLKFPPTVDDLKECGYLVQKT